jgi:pilus assembly protein CpaF
MNLSDRLGAIDDAQEKAAAAASELPPPPTLSKSTAPDGGGQPATAAVTDASTDRSGRAAGSATGRPTPVARRPRQANDRWIAAKRTVRALVLEELSQKIDGLHGPELEAEVRAALDRILRRDDLDLTVSPVERRAFVSEVISDTLGYGPLDALLADDAVTEVMCNAFDDIWVERHGRLELADTRFSDDAHYRKVIERIVARVGRRVDESSPMVDARLPDGSRVNAIVPPLALHGAALTIRRFAVDGMTAMGLVEQGTYTIDLVTVLDACVKGRMNMLIAGGTGTGKTTNLNILSSFIPDGERIITIEDAAELQLQQRHVVALEARPANAEGNGEVRIRDLVRNALRMRPDRIIVGECRGAEALDMLQAMNTGHQGSMTTVHANTPRDALSRLETMVLMAGFDLPMRAIREQIASAVDVIVQVDRQPDGRRVVSSVAEVHGLEGDKILLQEVFRLVPGAGSAPAMLGPTGLRPKFLDMLAERGIAVPATVFRTPIGEAG